MGEGEAVETDSSVLRCLKGQAFSVENSVALLPVLC